MGLISLLFDIAMVVFLVRAIVANEGHMAFNRPYQLIIQPLDPIWAKLKASEPQIRRLSWLGVLLLAGARGMVWALFGSSMLNFKLLMLQVSHLNLVQSQSLSIIAAVVFLLQVYAFITLALIIGDLETRTDHYSRLLRALLGPFRKLAPPVRCILPALALLLFWTVALWSLGLFNLVPQQRLGLTGCVLGALLITLALIVDLVNVWVALIILRAIFSLVPVIRTPVVDWIERLTEPALKPLYRFKLKAGQLDFTPVVSIVVLSLLHWGILTALELFYVKL